MKFKLDENFGSRTLAVFQRAGFDIQTVRDEKLQGTSDLKLFEICVAEKRCLVTLDLDFSDVTRFNPQSSSGVVVIRLPRNPNLSALENLVGQFIKLVATTDPANHLWIVEAGRIRIHQSDADELEG